MSSAAILLSILRVINVIVSYLVYIFNTESNYLLIISYTSCADKRNS